MLYAPYELFIRLRLRSDRSRTITRTLFLAVLPAAFAFVAVAGLGVNRRGGLAVAVLAISFALGVLLWAYLSASRVPDPSCEGCHRHLGRYWDLAYDEVLALVPVGFVALGAGVGAMVSVVYCSLKTARRANTRQAERHDEAAK